MLHKIGILKNFAKLTAKFMWAAAFGISENRPCLTTTNLLIFCIIGLKVNIWGIEPFDWDEAFNWSCTDGQPTSVPMLITQLKWYRRYIFIYRQLQQKTIEPSQFDQRLLSAVFASVNWIGLILLVKKDLLISFMKTWRWNWLWKQKCSSGRKQ